jgi:hypothetical protein
MIDNQEPLGGEIDAECPRLGFVFDLILRGGENDW